MSDLSPSRAQGRLRGGPRRDSASTLLASALEAGKLPPQAPELEQAVLGALMLERNAVNEAIDILQADSFYVEAHKRIFNSILELFRNDKPIDILTVTEELKKRGELDVVGGAFYISQLTSKVASSANVEYHARIISQKHILRELIRISAETTRDAYDDSADVFDLLDKAEQDLYAITSGNLKRNYEPMSDLIQDAIAQIENAKSKTSGVSGVPTGFTNLDKLTAGWQRSDMVIVAARPAMGKCLGKGTKVLMFDGTLKAVEDVRVGDQLMGDDSTPRNVLSLARGREAMYWVHQNHGISYRVNESHILSLKRSRREGGHAHGEVLNIEVRDFLARSSKFRSNYKGYKVAVDFPEQHVPIDPYFLGLWLGDGHSLSSRITTTDEEVVESMSELAGTLSRKLVVYQQEGKAPNYAITKGHRGGRHEASLQGDLAALGLLDNKHIPHSYIANTKEVRLALLAGLLDSDGHYNASFNVYEITQKDEALARSIKFLCDSLGFKTSIRSKTATIKDRGFASTVHRVRISGALDAIPVRIERKKARVRKASTAPLHTGIALEYDKIDDYYGFTIDGNRLFLLEDMTVTHNTAFVLSMARNIAVEHKKAVAVFSLEMSSTQLVTRLIASEAGISSEKLRKGELNDQEFAILHQHIARLTNAPIFIDDTPALNIFELRAKARRLKSQHNVDLIIIDYLQLMTGGGDNRGGNREQEISSISRSIKSIAKELDIPIIALSQLSRAVETRGGDKRPMLSDLRESGAIEQDADIVCFLYRPEYYKIYEDEHGSTLGIGEVIVAKHRNGALDTVRLRFIPELAKFADLDTMPGNFALDGMGSDDGALRTVTRPSRMNDDFGTDDQDAPF
ncbi:MAG: replicative DNA helicase [Flavobacteriales bacterium]